MSVSSLKTALLQGLAKPHTIINVDRHLYAYRTLALGQDADLFYGALGVWRTRPSSRFDLGLEAIYAPEQGNSIYSVDLGKSVLIGSYEHEDTPPPIPTSSKPWWPARIWMTSTIAPNP